MNKKEASVFQKCFSEMANYPFYKVTKLNMKHDYNI